MSAFSAGAGFGAGVKGFHAVIVFKDRAVMNEFVNEGWAFGASGTADAKSNTDGGSVSAAAAFDELTRSGRDDLMVRQIKNAWPNVFRASRFIPAVEYIQANRLREMSIDSMAAIMENIDVYISPTFEGDNLLLTNLTGHPCVVLPNGFTEDGTPVSITFIGGLYDEATLLAVAKMYQDATDFHIKHPPLFEE